MGDNNPDNWVNLLDIQIEETISGTSRNEKLSRLEVKKFELEEIQELEKKLSKSFENIRQARSDPKMKRQLRLNVRRLEIMAIMVDNIRHQIKSLEEIEGHLAHRGKHNDWEEKVAICERNITHLQQEILSARALFKNPITASTEYPPSPVLAVRPEMSVNLDEIGALTAKLSFGESGNPNVDPKEMGKRPDATGPPITPTAQNNNNDGGNGISGDINDNSNKDNNDEDKPVAPKVEVPSCGDPDVFKGFVMSPIPKHATFKVDIIRHKGRFGLNEYEMVETTSGRKIATAVKKAALGRHYKIYQYAGIGGEKTHLLADFSAGMGHHAFKLAIPSGFKGTPATEAAVVYYKVDHSDIEDTEYGVTLTVILPSDDLDDDTRRTVTKDLHAQYKQCEFDNIHVLNNKRAVWVPSMNTHILQYHSHRITSAGISSVKNFQLVSRLQIQHCLLEFGKIEEDRFEMTFQYPFSPLTALASCLVMFH